MPISVRCPNPACGKVTLAADEIAGRRVKCKDCSQVFTASATTDHPLSDAVALAPNVGAAPQRIGRFEVRGKLGQGAFGIVYRAYDPQLDREVALKVPNAGTLDSPKRVERFLREARAAAGLRHPHIVPVFDAGQDGGRYFIASAFIAGRKLADTFDERGTDLKRAARLVRELCEALAYAHEQGIVHRDVKPDNIMVDGDDHVHLMDFGLASRQDEESKLTSDGAVMGTPSYMSPEQARGQEGDAKPATDQYAAGVVLYELLTGRVPFEGPPAIVIHNQIHTEPEKPTTRRREIPKDLETICFKAMAKRPDDRYRSCGALAADLRRWLEDEPVTARVPGAMEQLGRWVKRNRAVATLSGAVVLVLVAGMVASAMLAAWANAEAGRANSEASRADEEARAARAALVQAQKSEELALAAATEVKESNDRALAAAAKTKVSDALAWAAAAKTKKIEEQAARDREIEQEKAARRRKQADNEKLAAEHQASLVKASQHAMLIGLALRSWELRNVALTKQILDLAAPRFQQSWETRHVRSLRVPGAWSLSAHTDWVYGVACCPNGRLIASGSRDRTVRVWDAQSGKEIRPLKGHTNDVNGVAFSHDGTRLASASDDNTVRVWNARTWESRTFKGHTGLGVLCVAFSPDPKTTTKIVGMYTTKTRGNLPAVLFQTVNRRTAQKPPSGRSQVTPGAIRASCHSWVNLAANRPRSESDRHSWWMCPTARRTTISMSSSIQDDTHLVSTLLVHLMPCRHQMVTIKSFG